MQSNLLDSGLLLDPWREPLRDTADVPRDDGLINAVSDQAIRVQQRTCVSLGARVSAPGRLDAHRRLIAGRLTLRPFDQMPLTPPAANGSAACRSAVRAARFVKHAL